MRVIPEESINYTLYAPGYPVHKSITTPIPLNETYYIEDNLTQVTGKKLHFNVTPSDAVIAVTVGGFIIEPVNGNYLMTSGCDYSYKISKEGYKPIKGVGTLIEDETLSFEMEEFYEYYNVTNISTPYGFELNANNYYESNNKGKDSSYALCKVDFISSTEEIILDCINSGESNYDFGIISNIDQTLSSSSAVDSTCFYSFKGKSSSSVQTVTIPVPDYNEHFITIKYRKDEGGASENDSLQFKVRFQ